jgi:hypothetical protein
MRTSRAFVLHLEPCLTSWARGLAHARRKRECALTTAITCVTLLATSPANGAANPSPRQSISGTYRYDPAIRRVHLDEQSAKTVSPNRTSQSPAPPGPKQSDNTLVLPTMTVRGAQEKLARTLPRLSADEPVMNIPVEPWESKEGRRVRLVKKHFTPLEQALGRMLGQNQQKRAGEKEAAVSAALQLNDVADLMELSALAGLDDAAEQKKLRAEYLKAYYARPR